MSYFNCSHRQLMYNQPNQIGTWIPQYEQPRVCLVFSEIVFTRYSNSLRRYLYFSRKEKKKIGPSTLKYITLTGSAVDTVFATSPKCIFKDSFKNCFMLVCIIQMPYDSCVMMTSVVLYMKLENSKIITKLLGLMGDKTRVVHQKKKSMMKSTMLEF